MEQNLNVYTCAESSSSYEPTNLNIKWKMIFDPLLFMNCFKNKYTKRIQLAYTRPTTDLSLGMSQLEWALLLQSKLSLLYMEWGLNFVRQWRHCVEPKSCGLLAPSTLSTTSPSTTSSIAQLRSIFYVQTPNVSYV